MAKIDLTKLDLSELKALRKDIEKAIERSEKTRKQEALRAAEEAAQKLGYSLDELVGKKSARAKSELPPKYRHPENPELTWSGRGRQPLWFKEALTSGGKPEDLAI